MGSAFFFLFLLSACSSGSCLWVLGQVGDPMRATHVATPMAVSPSPPHTVASGSRSPASAPPRWLPGLICAGRHSPHPRKMGMFKPRDLADCATDCSLFLFSPCKLGEGVGRQCFYTNPLLPSHLSIAQDAAGNLPNVRANPEGCGQGSSTFHPSHH